MRLNIPTHIKPKIVWVEYIVCQDNDWWLPVGIAELQIRQGRN